MKINKKDIFFLLFLIMSFHEISSQSLESSQKKIYQGYVSGNKNAWEEGISELEKLASNKSNFEVQYELLLAQYGRIGFLLSQESTKSKASAQLEKTLSLAQSTLKQYPKKGELKALIGGLYGLKIGLSPAKGIYLGPRSLRYLNDGTQMSPTHPAVWVEMANAKYHSPKLFGGSNQEAIKYFSKAQGLFEQSNNKYRYNWLYLHTLAWLGQAYEKAEEWDKAESTYRQALKLWPDFEWVKEELIPQLEQNRAQ